MVRITAALTVAAAAAMAPASAFAPVFRSPIRSTLSASSPQESGEPTKPNNEATWESHPRPTTASKPDTVYDGEIDFDAPVDPFKVTSGSNGASAVTMEAAPVVDDDCYLGKDAQMTECVDFDPPVTAKGLQESEEPTKLDNKATWESHPRPTTASKPDTVYDGEIDFDAPVDPFKVTSGSNGASAVIMEAAPVVDEDCYLGKDAQMTDCVDFDPPKSGFTPP